jgi:hypothetical protein
LAGGTAQSAQSKVLNCSAPIQNGDIFKRLWHLRLNKMANERANQRQLSGGITANSPSPRSGCQPAAFVQKPPYPILLFTGSRF